MRVIELFKELTKIPRCSGTYKPFLNYIKGFAKKNNYSCKIDNYNNVLCFNSNKPKYSIQNHYDIVCLNDNKIEIIEDDKYLKAKNTTLGADNGIGIAIMLDLMEKQENIEFLFTSDEEIGLIGANNLELELKSNKMINIDTEEIGAIFVGCAGGIDIFAELNIEFKSFNNDDLNFYKIDILDLVGGHSGVDIDKNIPNAIKELIKKISDKDYKIISINGGERINSIPKNCFVIIATKKSLEFEKVKNQKYYISNIDELINYLNNFKNGVLEFSKKYNIVDSSINLAIIETLENKIKVSFSLRSMDNKKLEDYKNNLIKELKNLKLNVLTEGKYNAWQPKDSDLAVLTKEIYSKQFKDVKLKVVHAGLECAVFSEKFPNLEIISIGPTINYPHSLREEIKIDTIQQIYDVVKELIKS